MPLNPETTRSLVGVGSFGVRIVSKYVSSQVNIAFITHRLQGRHSDLRRGVWRLLTINATGPRKLVKRQRTPSPASDLDRHEFLIQRGGYEVVPVIRPVTPNTGSYRMVK